MEFLIEISNKLGMDEVDKSISDITVILNK